jgi:voltage-gated potassium channel
MLIFGLLILSFIDTDIKSIRGGTQGFLEELYKLVIAMTTVGYGDILVEDSVIRICVVAGIIFGAFVSSMLTVTVLNFFKLSEKEIKAHNILKRLEAKC